MSERLWRAVVLMSLQDIASKSNSNNQALHRAQAKAWLGTKDFYLVCELAGIQYSTVLLAAKKLEEGFNWRAPAGTSRYYTYRKERRLKQRGMSHPSKNQPGALSLDDSQGLEPE